MRRGRRSRPVVVPPVPIAADVSPLPPMVPAEVVRANGRCGKGKEKRRKRRWPPSGFATIRDCLLFALGTAVILYEVFWTKALEPFAVGAGVALLGVPVAFSSTEERKG